MSDVFILQNGIHSLPLVIQQLIENLIGIPGSVGAAPVQNIGAYGVQVSDFIKSINVYDFEDKTFKKLLKDQCDFGYRSSIFQTKL